MPLSINSQAPDFTLPATSGQDITLSKDLAGKPCVLFFYPKDFTSVCTKEACGFRDNFDTFKSLDVTVLGINTDSIATHKRFKKANDLPFELLTDEKGVVSKAYKAVVPIVGMTKRVTYLLGANHKIVAAYQEMFGWEKHIVQMIKALKAGMDKRVER